MIDYVRLVGFARSEIRQRSHRNRSLLEGMPKLRTAVEAAEKRLAKAKADVADVEYNVDVNNEAIDTMEEALVELDSDDGDVVDGARGRILRYTRSNSITVTGDLTLGF